MKKATEQPTEYESQKASTQVHAGGCYTLNKGKPVPVTKPVEALETPEASATKGAK